MVSQDVRNMQMSSGTRYKLFLDLYSVVGSLAHETLWTAFNHTAGQSLLLVSPVLRHNI